MTARARPLSGIRAVDMADERGELCGRLLGDLGAETIRVEPPSGARSRRMPPFTPDGVSSIHFALRNAGKRGVTLDLGERTGREALHNLLAGADVWIESYAPGFLAHRGLDPAGVLDRHPHLVIVSITDFGQTGPYRDFAGTDMIAYAMGGMLYRAGAAHRPPVMPPGMQAYDSAAVTAAFAAVAALFQRRRCGRGQWIDVSVQEATSNLADWTVPILSTLQMYSRREGAGMYPVYRCADGWVRMVIIGLRHWRTLRAWMGEPAELQDPSYDEFIARLWNRDKIEPLIQRHFAAWNKIDAAREAQSRGIQATPVLRPPEALDNEHVRARGTFARLEIVPERHVLAPSGFFEIDGERIGPTARAPEIGEHNVEVVTEAARRPATRGAGAADWRRPFAGLRGLDFGVGVAGVEVGRLLAEYGAEVIKIESSKAPDFIRTVMPGRMNAPFASSNRTKLSLGVDLKTPAGVDLVKRLVPLSDVVIENSATGVMERLGFGYENLKAINPRIIMFSTQMMGSSGPWRNWTGYGPNAHAASGLQYLWNFPEDAGTPAGSSNIHPDHVVARLGALGVAAALVRRERDGLGCHIEVAQFETLIQLLGDLFVLESLAPGSVHPQGNHGCRGAPAGVYPCKGDDEWCAIEVRSDEEWDALCAALGYPEWAAHAAYRGAEGRLAARDRIDEGIAAWTCEQAAAEVMRVLQAAGVPAGIVDNPRQQLDDPHLQARGFFRKIDQPGLGEVIVEGPGFRAAGMDGPAIAPAPLLGQHTRTICRSLLRMPEDRIEALFAAGVLEETLPD